MRTSPGRTGRGVWPRSAARTGAAAAGGSVSHASGGRGSGQNVMVPGLTKLRIRTCHSPQRRRPPCFWLATERHSAALLLDMAPPVAVATPCAGTPTCISRRRRPQRRCSQQSLFLLMYLVQSQCRNDRMPSSPAPVPASAFHCRWIDRWFGALQFCPCGL
ncbi:hypothetical protein SETIT_3G397600v2 [Setaria italica]|uniref:Uncharacterized protein n=1 Tax=Setaria italica TaxID=4555 RepID=A0A368QNM9_SETIT|nr:hypothetical protein SETIT_3G397600v2 [Setaria italica]